MPAWPSTIPQFPVGASYQEKPEIDIAKKDNPVGAPVYRSRSEIDAYEVIFTMMMDSAEIELFKAFYRDTLLDGILSFTYNDPVTGENETFSFISAPTISPVYGLLYTMAFNLRRMP